MHKTNAPRLRCLTVCFLVAFHSLISVLKAQTPDEAQISELLYRAENRNIIRMARMSPEELAELTSKVQDRFKSPLPFGPNATPESYFKYAQTLHHLQNAYHAEFDAAQRPETARLWQEINKSLAQAVYVGMAKTNTGDSPIELRRAVRMGLDAIRFESANDKKDFLKAYLTIADRIRVRNGADHLAELLSFQPQEKGVNVLNRAENAEFIFDFVATQISAPDQKRALLEALALDMEHVLKSKEQEWWGAQQWSEKIREANEPGFNSNRSDFLAKFHALSKALFTQAEKDSPLKYRSFALALQSIDQNWPDKAREQFHDLFANYAPADRSGRAAFVESLANRMSLAAVPNEPTLRRLIDLFVLHNDNPNLAEWKAASALTALIPGFKANQIGLGRKADTFVELDAKAAQFEDWLQRKDPRLSARAWRFLKGSAGAVVCGMAYSHLIHQ